MHSGSLPPAALFALVGVALLFDFLNGMHDSSNSIATVVSTRVLRPVTAVFWAAFFNFIAFLVFGLHVANTVGNGLVMHGVIDARVVFGALAGAIAWNVITWIFGIPSSSSHALIGGLVGSAMAKAGPAAIHWSGLDTVAAAILLSPLIGFLLAVGLVLATAWLSLRETPFAADRRYRVLQLVSSSLLSLGHGGNDAQKTMGIITVLLLSQGRLHGGFHVPLWVSCPASRRWPSAPSAAAGASCARSARASPISSRSRASAPRPAARWPCSAPPGSAYRSRPRTPSSARWSASVPRDARPRCAGASRAASWWPGW